ncbi:MAG: adenylate/guanylate cyclase domain-containing protein [Polyangiaceae bacterium]|nr:adenylate/guanylate cyclase domain-containing protein [Polyangiaceae bacterium]
MGMKDDIVGRLKEVLATGDYSITDSDSIPGPGDNRLTFGNTGVRFWASTLYIDMRGSTKVLNQFKAHNVAKIHKAYLYTATTLIADAGGQIRSYNGDSILAFFPKNEKATINKAVKTAMHIKWMLTEDSVKKLFEPYQHVLDFGIGIDHGQVLCVKAGLARNDNHNDLVWLGDAVNRAVRLSDRGRSPNCVYVSDICRTNMDGDTKLANGVDMWVEDFVEYNGSRERAWRTNYGWVVK